MTRVVWATDIHLEFVDGRRRHGFFNFLCEAAPDAVLISGDIGTAPNVEAYLTEMTAALSCPILFVLGNHDFYGGSIADVRSRVARLASTSPRLTYLSSAGVVELSPDVCVVGHDGWGDARLGDFERSNVSLNDFALITELTDLPRAELKRRLQRLGDEAARHFQRVLPEGLERFRHVLIATHVPPFRESCWHQGGPSDDDWLPFFACGASGDAIREAVQRRSDRRVTVLCGHTHSGGEAAVLPNLVVLTGPADYGDPRIQRVFEFGDE